MNRGHFEFIKDLVSIVIPVFNGGYYLQRMLDSILNQTYPQIEMILVDDGSTDDTVQTAQRYQQRFAERGFGYRIIQSAHKNASAAINQGLPYVTGEYLIWPDSDDILEPESVEKRVEFLKKIHNINVSAHCPIILTRIQENRGKQKSSLEIWQRNLCFGIF